MADEPKQGELLPAKAQAQPVALDELIRAAVPLMDKYSETEIATAKEVTRRAELQLGVENNRDKRAFITDLVVFLTAAVMFGMVLGFGIYKENLTFVLSSITGFISFTGGFGFGRKTSKKQEE